MLIERSSLRLFDFWKPGVPFCSRYLRPYPQFGNVSLGATNVGNSIYHSLQAKVTKRFSTSLITMAYTLSKGIGDSEAVTAAPSTRISLAPDRPPLEEKFPQPA